MEELKVVMQAVQSMADTGLTAFIWWLVMDKFIWWLLLVFTVATVAWGINRAVIAAYTESSSETRLKELRDVLYPAERGTSVMSSEVAQMRHALQAIIAERGAKS